MCFQTKKKNVNCSLVIDNFIIKTQQQTGTYTYHSFKPSEQRPGGVSQNQQNLRLVVEKIVFNNEPYTLQDNVSFVPYFGFQ